MKNEANLGPPDVGLLTTVVLMVAFGVLLVFDASYAKTGGAKWAGYDVWYMVKRQVVYAIVGLCAMLIVSRIRLRWFLRMTAPVLILSMLMLIAVMIPGIGYKANGAYRWFKVGPISIQPSELAKLAVVLYLSGFLARRKDRIRGANSSWFTPVLTVAIVAGLIVLEPDMGTSIAVVAVAFGLWIASGALLKHVFALAVCVAVLAGLAVIMQPYRFDRITTWLDPWRDRYGDGYQVIHSLIALGTGGLTGVGPCEGREKFYLPAASTDFIFATVGEELGLLGCCVLLAAFLWFTYRGFEIARKCNSCYGNLLGVGVTSMVSLQALINVAVVSSSIPATGVPLPFISYGGSSLMSMLVATGILLALSRQTNVTLEERELNESDLDRWRDRRSRVPRHKYRTSATGSRSARKVAVRR